MLSVAEGPQEVFMWPFQELKESKGEFERARLKEVQTDQ